MTVISQDYYPRVAERLSAAFGDQHSPVTITLVLAQCRSDLRGAPVGAMPELLERLATQRLLHASLPTQHAGGGHEERTAS